MSSSSGHDGQGEVERREPEAEPITIITAAEKWWLVKKPKTITSDVRKKDPKQAWGLCITCFRNGANPDIFKLCRRDKSTVKRHNQRRHGTSEGEIRGFFDQGAIVGEARCALLEFERQPRPPQGKKSKSATQPGPVGANHPHKAQSRDTSNPAVPPPKAPRPKPRPQTREASNPAVPPPKAPRPKPQTQAREASNPPVPPPKAPRPKPQTQAREASNPPVPPPKAPRPKPQTQAREASSPPVPPPKAPRPKPQTQAREANNPPVPPAKGPSPEIQAQARAVSKSPVPPSNAPSPEPHVEVREANNPPTPPPTGPRDPDPTPQGLMREAINPPLPLPRVPSHMPQVQEREASKTTQSDTWLQTRLPFSTRDGETTVKSKSVEEKIDFLVEGFKELKLSMDNRSLPQSTPLSAIGGSHSREIAEMLLNWQDVRNLPQLVESCNHLRFFAGNEGDVLSVLRCETCYTFLMREKKQGIPNHVTVARKGISGMTHSLATGLIYDPDKTAVLLQGGCQEFYKLKSTVKNHVTLAGGQLHFEALQYAQEQQRRSGRSMAVTQNLVAIALTVVNTKSAASHYETMVATHAFTGADVGEFAHGRKQFSEILRCADAFVNRETATFLQRKLPSTMLPPHYYATTDKSTPHRLTNQDMLICPMVNGKRQAIAVSSPEVYHGAETDVEGDVTGGTAALLAERLFVEMKRAFPSIPEADIQATWMGTVCDGAYQASGFRDTLRQLLNQGEGGIFFDVLWDPPHFVDLAFRDVFDGKSGKSSEFMSRLIDRAAVVHRIFQRGKMLSHVKEMAKTVDDLVLKLTSSVSSTRFSTSQYVEFRKLVDSLPLYIKTFREFKYSELKEYQIAGSDFVMDLCGTCDILRPFMHFFNELQGLSVPCWKVVVWWEQLQRWMEVNRRAFSLQNVPTAMQLLRMHLPDITRGSFKGAELVPGWLVVSSETSEEQEGTKKTVDTWKVREQEDVETDLKRFMADLTTAFEKRVSESSKPILNVLSCLDLDTIFGKLCGERLPNGRVKLAAGEGALERHGTEGFARFFGYVCSLEHIRQLDAESEEELFFDPSLSGSVFHRLKQALKSFLWGQQAEHLQHWFGLSSTKGCLQKLEIVDLAETAEFSLGNRYRLSMMNGQVIGGVHLDETEVYKSIYTEEPLYSEIGVEGCVAIDIALAKGGSEAVVESFYSVMDSQKMPGGQQNETLSLRTKLDWCFPPILQAERAIRETAELYLNGDKEAGLPRHAAPILGDRAKYRNESKVLKRQRGDQARLPFLL